MRRLLTLLLVLAVSCNGGQRTDNSNQPTESDAASQRVVCDSLSFAHGANGTNIYVSTVSAEAEQPIGATSAIYYTSTDGAIIYPHSDAIFDARIVSNTYEDGVGVIRFDGPITFISRKAFFENKELKSIVIPYGVKEIGALAFKNCPSLGYVSIPSSVRVIANSAFDNCPKLDIYIPEGVTTIERAAFRNCSEHKDLILPKSLTSIGAMAFMGCTGIVSVTIPDGVQTIGAEAFDGCTSIVRVTIPDGVQTIGDDAFKGCSSLRYVTINNDNIIIEPCAFYGCNISYFYGKCAAPDGKALISNGRLIRYAARNSAKSYKIPNSVTEIGDYAFYDCTSLTSINIPNSVTEIGYCAFEGCTSLTSITIPNSVTSIEDYAFVNCTSLTSITIPNSVTSIGDGAFGNCSSLTSITIPNSVTEIGDEAAFASCDKLKCFYGKFATPDGKALISNGRLIAYAAGNSAKSYKIPNNVTEIGGRAFAGCTSLTSITIPNSVTSIGDNAFWGSSLTSITIPNSVTEIGDYAFGDCTSLTSITIPSSVTSIGHDAFVECTSLKEVYCKAITPPSMELAVSGYGQFEDNAEDRKIYVPKESVEVYKKAAGWSGYADAIVGYDFAE